MMSSSMIILALLWSSLTGCCSRCPLNVLVLYRMILHTEWSEENFPKQYPTWRPPAQWSVALGRSHNSSSTLWRFGKTASDSFKLFTETGKVDMLISGGTQQKRGILTEFFAPPIIQGVGFTETKFFTDGLHSKVSVSSRLIPSPDWFVGVDSYDLCHGHRWVDQVTLDLDPIDGGTDDGYTFTAPDIATHPRDKISRIHSSFPDHPSSSFFYPELQKLPRIATITFIKRKEFLLNKQAFADDSKAESWKWNETERESSAIDSSEGFQNKEDQNSSREKKRSILYVSEKGKFFLAKKYRNRRKACRVSQWSEWEECTKMCGFGEQVRRRKVIHSKNDQPCPPLEESKRCRNMMACQNQTIGFFRWI